MLGVIAQRLGTQVKRSYWLTNLYYVLSNLHRERLLSKNLIDTGGGTTHALLSPDASLEYIETVFEDYKKYGGVDNFHGRIAEIGAGDSCGVAMLLLQDGSTSVDLPDRFYSQRDTSHQSRVYQALWDRYPGLPEILGNPDPLSEETFRRIRRYHGDNAACEHFFESHQGYDFIVSRSVLEHLFDPCHSLKSMANALRPGGKIIHKVDLRDHGMYSEHFHELKFLETPAWLHSRMTTSSGRPNRNLINVYRDTLKSLGMTHNFLVTRLAGVGEITPHVPYEDIPDALTEKAVAYVKRVRPRLAKAFRKVSDAISLSPDFFL